MGDFRQLTGAMWASPQITADDLTTASQAGITTIINNRPEGESPDQTPGDAIARAAADAGMDYVAIPVTHAGFSREQVDAMRAALADARGPVLAYCRSGTRSTLLWALARAADGDDPDGIAEAAQNAGYDLAPIRSLIDMLAIEARG